MNKCDGCNYDDDGMCVCMTKCPKSPKKQTNYDLMRNMSIDEMAAFLFGLKMLSIKRYKENGIAGLKCKNAQEQKQWLEREVSE